MFRIGITAALAVCLCLCGACGTTFMSPRATEARLGEVTASTEVLQRLPQPKEKIVVAVYKFRDQTGQYKPSENGNSWSTAVTQGATTILMKALEDSRWFLPIERENVGNLLNERKIIRSSRAQYAGEDEAATPLPPLLFAGVLIEGGVISYDANIVTGGAGLRYFGAGGSKQYRQDRITVYLRAVSTSNGQVLKTVYTSKTILSQALDAGLFQFVRFNRLLETEIGFTYNEPAEMAVSEAIQKAVQSLVIEGVADGVWALKEPRMSSDRTFLDYQKEKAAVPRTDLFGKTLDTRRATVGLGLNAATLRYKGDYPDPVYATGVEADLTYSPSATVGAELSFGLSRLATKRSYAERVSYLNLDVLYRPVPFDVFTPVFSGGGGLVTENLAGRFDLSNPAYLKAQAGVGFEYFLADQWSLRSMASFHYVFSDRLDRVEQGKYNDLYYQGNVGLTFYPGRKVTSERTFDFGGAEEIQF